jgi:transcriptional regulator with XRE-family HTH domain
VRHTVIPAGIDLGAVIRGRRAALRLTQAQLGRACGYSASAVSRVESNELVPDLDVLLPMLRTLGIPSEDLGLAAHPAERNPMKTPPSQGRPAAPETRVTPRQHPREAEEDPVRRRDLLGTAIGLGAALVTATPARAAASADPMAGLETSLWHPAEARPATTSQLDAALAAARSDFEATRYTRLGARLPSLIAAAEASRDTASGRPREQAHAAVARAYILATELANKEHSQLSWATADRAMAAARASGDPIPLGEAARVLAFPMRRAGRPTSAAAVLTSTAAELDGDTDKLLAVRTSLLLTAAYTAATAADAGTAETLIDEAEVNARRLAKRPLPDGLFTVDASPAQCTLYRISIANALGDPDRGVAPTRALAPVRFRTAEREGRKWTDMARVWAALGERQRTFACLRAVAQVSPEEVERPSLRALTANLLYDGPELPGLREFALRTGAAT